MLTNYLIYLHLPRTGGTSLRRLLGRIPGVRIDLGRAHQSYDTYADGCIRRGNSVPPSFIFVRNPFGWYVSQWSWQRRVKGTKKIAEFDEWLKAIDAQSVDLNHCPITSAWEFLQGDKATYIGRFEDYENEVVRILLAILPKGLVNKRWIQGKMKSIGRRASTSNPCGGSYRDCYNDETQELVMKLDEKFIERFTYEF